MLEQNEISSSPPRIDIETEQDDSPDSDGQEGMEASYLRFSESFRIHQRVLALTCFETDLEGRSVQHDK